MKILHTSDWHLGKKLYKTSRLDEQRLFLDYLIQTIQEKTIEVLIMAGDLFDVPRPSDESLTLYFQFLKKLQEQTDAVFCLISGNHDSGRFLDAPKPLLDLNRFYVAGKFHGGESLKKVHLTGLKGESVELTLLPFFRSTDLLELDKGDNQKAEVSERLLANLQKLIEASPKQSPTQKNILIAHHLFGDSTPCGTEQGLHLSGLQSVPLQFLKGQYDYVALGHIHRAQCLQKRNPIINYSGSPLPFRFGEKGRKKIFIYDSLTDDIETIELPIWRQLRTIQTTSGQLIADLKKEIALGVDSKLSELWEIKCEIDKPSAGLADLAREITRSENLEILSFQTYITQNGIPTEEKDTIRSGLKDYSTEKLFEVYYQEKYPQSTGPSAQLKEEFHELLASIRAEHKEDEG